MANFDGYQSNLISLQSLNMTVIDYKFHDWIDFIAGEAFHCNPQWPVIFGTIKNKKSIKQS